MSLMIRIVGILPVSRLRKLAWQRSLINAFFRRSVRKAKKTGNPDETECAQSDWRFENALIDEEENQVVSQNLIREARRHRIPLPPYDVNETGEGYWEEGQAFGGKYLNDHGVLKLRKEIRVERKADNELRAHWIAWLAALTGVIGAVSGLIAILSSLKQ